MLTFQQTISSFYVHCVYVFVDSSDDLMNESKHVNFIIFLLKSTSFKQ